MLSMKTKKIIITTIISLSAVLLLIAFAWFSGRIISRCQPDKFWSIPEVASFAGNGKVATAPGKTVDYQALLMLPYGCEVSRIFVNAPDGAVASGQPDIILKSLWDRQEVKITFALRPFRSGKISGGEVEVEIVAPDNSLRHAQIKIPEIEAVEIKDLLPESEVELAPEEFIKLPDNNVRQSLFVGIVVLLIAIAVSAGLMIYYMRRRKKKLSAVEMTLLDLTILRQDISDELCTPRQGFVRLVDIMKNFLANRFGVILFSSTTDEILAEMESHRQIFLPECRGFFRDFLRRADMVKFAGDNADAVLINSAIEGAENLVRAADVADLDEDKSK